MGFSPYDAKLPDWGNVKLTDATVPNTPQTVFGGYSGYSAGLIRCLVTSTDTVDRLMDLFSYDSNSSVSYKIGAMTIPALAGNGTVPTIDLATLFVGLLGGWLVLPPGHMFQISITTALTALAELHLSALDGLM